MKRLKISGLLVCAFACMLCFACSSDSNDTPQNGTDSGTTGTIDDTATDVDVPDSTDDDLTANSQDLSSLSTAVFVTFSSSGAATVISSSDVSGVEASISDNHVTITSSASSGVNYVLSGITTDGQFHITSDNKYNLYLNGVGITNSTGAAIYSAQKAMSVVIQDNTANRLIDSSASEDKAALYSKGKISFDGNGSLEVRGKVKHAISSGNEITINSGTIYVKEAASDAIHGDCVYINGGDITTYSEGEGIDGDEGEEVVITGGTLYIATSGKKGHGIKTSTSDDGTIIGNISISGGDITVITTGIASKAINSDGNISITGGTFTLETQGSAYFDTDDQDTSSSACIKCDGNLSIANATISAKSHGAGGKGFNAGGTLIIESGTIDVTTTGNQYVYSSKYDTAAKAIKSTGNLTINGGTITVRTSKTEAEGIESKATLTINDGVVDVIAYDDGLNASNHIQINGGKVYSYSSSNDGIDSNGTLTVTGGVVIASGTTSPEEGFDCDSNTFKITGGVLIGTGGSTSTPTSSASTQRSIIWGGTGTSGQYINLTDPSGNSILSYKIPRSYGSSMTLLLSSPDISSTGSYSLSYGGSLSGGTEVFNGYYTGGTYSGGSKVTVSVSSMVTTVGNSSGTGGGGGPR